MKGLYIYFDFIRDEEREKHVGILKKIHGQRQCLERNLGGECELVNLPRALGQNSPLLFFSFLLSTRTFDLSPVTGRKYDYVYIRRIDPVCRSVIRMLRTLRKENPHGKIVWEIPSYPYDPLYRMTFPGKLKLPIDSFYRTKLVRYVDRIVTLTPDDKLFGCRTLKITNGAECGMIPVSKKSSYDHESINLIAVAQFGFMHGYERVVKGLLHYQRKNIILHFVGDGDELRKYKALTKKYELEAQVLFYGPLFGEQLSDIFNNADIALCPLAAHRANLFSPA
ncbi:MAG: glycosyltransferase, partial [Ruminococcus sp.]|nr:glycosyltransferase [Ruminococcus sp.]